MYRNNQQLIEASLNIKLKNTTLSIGQVPEYYEKGRIADDLVDIFRMSQKMFEVLEPQSKLGKQVFFVKFATVELMTMVYNKRAYFEEVYGWNVCIPFSNTKLFGHYYMKSSDIVMLHE